jgi:hypothetical protein
MISHLAVAPEPLPVQPLETIVEEVAVPPEKKRRNSIHFTTPLEIGPSNTEVAPELSKIYPVFDDTNLMNVPDLIPPPTKLSKQKSVLTKTE